jgi:hypothetical protein
MSIDNSFSIYAQWSGYLTIFCVILTILAFILKWDLRFRLFGATSFMAVVTLGIFALGLGLFTRELIPGAAKFSLVYDNGANQAVIVVPATIKKSELEPTLRQAAHDLFSYGRIGGGGDNQFTVRARAVVHTAEGISKPLYIGQAKRSFADRSDKELKIEVFSKNFANLPRSQNEKKS